MTRQMVLWAAGALVLVLAGAGCSDDDKQQDAGPQDAAATDRGQLDGSRLDTRLDLTMRDTADGPALGGEGQPCREDGSCDDELVCSAEQICVATVGGCLPACDPSDESCVDGQCLPTGAPLIKVCAQTCQSDADCALGTGALPFRCHPTSKRCVECLGDLDCAIRESVWTYPCTVGGDECVDAYESCIDVGGGAGRCAERATDQGTCAFGGSEPEDWPLLDGSGEVSVCIDRSASCSTQNRCLIAVQETPDCTEEGCDLFGGVGRPDCDQASKRCVCNATSCAATGYSQCLPDGTCGCSEDNECVASPAASTCYPDGRCGCTDDATCQQDSSFAASGAACVEAPFAYPW